MRNKDLIWGLLLLLVGTVVAAYARTFPAAPGQVIGPGVFPMLIGGGIAVCGALLAWSGRTSRRDPAPLASVGAGVRGSGIRNPVLVIGALVFYVATVETAGFFVTAFVFLGVLFLAFGVRRRWIAPIAAGVTLALHVAFYTLLRVPLPWGWLEGFAW